MCLCSSFFTYSVILFLTYVDRSVSRPGVDGSYSVVDHSVYKVDLIFSFVVVDLMEVFGLFLCYLLYVFQFWYVL